MSEQRTTIAWCGDCGNVSVDGINFASPPSGVFEWPPGYLECAACSSVGPFEYRQVAAVQPPKQERASTDEVAVRAAIEREMGVKVGPPMAYRGKAGCANPTCTIGPGYPDTCYGWHCPRCDEPCSMMGHECAPQDPQERAA